MSGSDIILELKNVHVHYRNVHAVDDLSFQVPRGKIVTLIGSNGAGKTSTMKAISGLVPVSRGAVHYKNATITNLQPHEIVKKKICQAPEGRGIFLNLTVEENLDLGAWTAPDKSTFAADLANAFKLFPRLEERRKQNAGTLSGGEQQMLAIARALMAHPDLLLLDEPSLGLAPKIIEKIFEIIVEINKKGMSILLVEQNAYQALQIAHYGLVLETGKKVLEGAGQDLLKSDEIKKAYLG